MPEEQRADGVTESPAPDEAAVSGLASPTNGQEAAVAGSTASPAIAGRSDADSRRDDGKLDSGWHTARRLLALVVVVVVIGGYFAARVSDDFRSCSTKVTTTSGTPPKTETEQTCEPLTVEAMLPGLLLALALMWPDLTSVEVFGLGRINRRLIDQEGRQNDLAAAQQRLENMVSATATASAVAEPHQTVHVGTDPVAAALVRDLVARRQGEKAPEPFDTPPGTSKEELLASFGSAAEPLRPWLEVARRLNDPEFRKSLEAVAPSGALADAPGRIPREKKLLARIQRVGQPFDLSELMAWSTENELQIATVRETLRAEREAAAESLRVATEFADQLRSDLRRRGLLASD